MTTNKGKNIGEWSEMYIFFKLMSDRKVYVADKDMNRLKDVFLNIISIIREENKGKEYRYFTGDVVKITLNGEEVATVDSSRFTDNAKKVWDMIISKKDTTFSKRSSTSSLRYSYKTSLLPRRRRANFSVVRPISSWIRWTTAPASIRSWAFPANPILMLLPRCSMLAETIQTLNMKSSATSMMRK